MVERGATGPREAGVDDLLAQLRVLAGYVEEQAARLDEQAAAMSEQATRLGKQEAEIARLEGHSSRARPGLDGVGTRREGGATGAADAPRSGHRGGGAACGHEGRRDGPCGCARLDHWRLDDDIRTACES